MEPDLVQRRARHRQAIRLRRAVADEDRHRGTGRRRPAPRSRPAPAWPSDGTAIPRPARSALVHGPAHTTAARRGDRAGGGPDGDLAAVVRDAGGRGDPGADDRAPPPRAPRSGASALITHGFRLEQGRAADRDRGNLAAASAAGQQLVRRARAVAWPRGPRPARAPKVRCGVGCSSRWPHSSSSSDHGPRARMATPTQSRRRRSPAGRCGSCPWTRPPRGRPRPARAR